MMIVPIGKAGVAETLEILRDARVDYEKRGYAKGVTKNDKGQTCAVGSVAEVAYLLEDPEARIAACSHAVSRLSSAAYQRYQRPITRVNDDSALGHNAVLDCYDLAIKNCESELEKP